MPDSPGHVGTSRSDLGTLGSIHTQQSNDAREVSRLIESFQRDSSLLAASHASSAATSSQPTTRRVIALLWFLAFSSAAILSLIFAAETKIFYLALWRCFSLFASLPIVWYIPQIVVFLSVVLLERAQPSDGQGQIVYLLTGCRKRAVWFLRCLMMQVILHVLISGSTGGSTWEGNLMRFWTCISLILAGSICSALIARSLSHHFHSKTYFTRMRDAIRKEHFLHVLSRAEPPSHRSDNGDLESGPSIFRKLAHSFSSRSRPSAAPLSCEIPEMPPPGDREQESLLKNKESDGKNGWVWFSGLQRQWVKITGPASRRKPSTREELEKGLYWLEKHCRSRRPQFMTLTDQLQAAADDRSKGAQTEEVMRAEAKELAFLLMRNILGADLSRPFIVAPDLERFFPSSEEVKEVFDTLSHSHTLTLVASGAGKATIDSITDAIYRILKERSKIAATLTDQKSIVTKLQFVAQFVIQFLLVLVFLWIFEVDIGSLWISISSICLAFAFIFGNSIRQMYESVLFLFIVHSFDVGDWLALPNGDVVKVEEIALMAITAQRLDGRRLYVPIASLQESIVTNISRSENLWESFAFLIDFEDPQCSKAVDLLTAELKAHVEARKSEFTGEHGVIARAYEGHLHKLKVVAYLEYTHTGEDTTRLGFSRSDLLLALCRVLDRAGISHTNPAEHPLRVQNGMDIKEMASYGDRDADEALFVCARSSGGGLLLSKKRE